MRKLGMRIYGKLVPSFPCASHTLDRPAQPAPYEKSKIFLRVKGFQPFGICLSRLS